MSNEEQNAAHSFDKEEDDIRGYYEPDDRPQSMKDLAEKLRLEKQIELAELTRLRSELQQKDEVIKELLVIADDIIGGMERFPNRQRKEDEYALRSLIVRAKELLKSKAK